MEGATEGSAWRGGRAGGWCVALLAAWPAWLSGAPAAPADEWGARYAAEVTPRLELPAADERVYAAHIRQALAASRVALDRGQWLVAVDRSAAVQAVMVWWASPGGELALVGASPAATGRPGRFEHFETPTGVFEHTLAHGSFRAEGTRNAMGIRGYGLKGMRVFDFGWVLAPRGWAPGSQPMRLQMHATDPDALEPRLGERASKGCIRIPASLNTFIDRHALLDAAWDEALTQGRSFWVLRPDREPTAWPGRYLVVIDSGRNERPDWSPTPAARRQGVLPGVAQREAAADCGEG